MLASEVKGLECVYSEMLVNHDGNLWMDSGELAWRVLIKERFYAYFPMRFCA